MKNPITSIRHTIIRLRWRFITEFKLHPVENFGCMLQAISVAMLLNAILVCFVVPYLEILTNQCLDYTFMQLTLIIFVFNALYSWALFVIGRALIRTARKTWMN